VRSQRALNDLAGATVERFLDLFPFDIACGRFMLVSVSGLLFANRLSCSSSVCPWSSQQRRNCFISAYNSFRPTSESST